MKSGIHPTYFHDAVVTCTCGNKFTTGSTKQEIKVDICSACHPFFTGEMRFVDTMGRVEKFQAKQAHAQEILKQQKSKKKVEKEEIDRPTTLREMMLREQKKLEAKEKASKTN